MENTKERSPPFNDNDLFECKSDAFWESLSEEERMMAFHAVVSRLVKCNIDGDETYEYSLYGEFGFPRQSYQMGINCGYMKLYNKLKYLREKYANDDISYKNNL